MTLYIRPVHYEPDTPTPACFLLTFHRTTEPMIDSEILGHFAEPKDAREYGEYLGGTVDWGTPIFCAS